MIFFLIYAGNLLCLGMGYLIGRTERRPKV